MGCALLAGVFALLPGCSPLRQGSAGQIGCPPQEIVIADAKHGWSAATWTASCRGHTYHCSYVATSDAVDYACAPELVEHTCPPTKDPALPSHAQQVEPEPEPEPEPVTEPVTEPGPSSGAGAPTEQAQALPQADTAEMPETTDEPAAPAEASTSSEAP